MSDAPALRAPPIKPDKVKGGLAEMLAITLPMVISNACETVMTFVDRLFLARLDTLQMNAALNGGVTFYVFMTFFLGLIGYGTALVGQYLGSEQRPQCAVTLTQLIIISAVAAPVIYFAAPLARGFYAATELPESQIEHQMVYFNTLIIGVVFVLIRGSFASFFSGIGETRIVMAATFVSMIVNIAVNYLLIFGHFGFPRLEIFGAAIGTIIGTVSGLLVMAARYFSADIRRRFGVRQSFRFDFSVIRKLFRFGTPGAFEAFLGVFSFNLMIVLLSQGERESTATTLLFTWEGITFMPLMGIQIGVTSLVGKYKGAQDIPSAVNVMRSGFKLGMTFCGAVFVIFLIFTGPMVRMFDTAENPELFESAFPLAVFMLRTMTLFIFINCVMTIIIGVLRGAGDTVVPMFITIALSWTAVLTLYVVREVLGHPIETGWIAMILVYVPAGLFYWLRYRTGRWKSIEMV